MVTYDFSDYSKEALVFALELADELKSDLMIVNVINQRDVEALRRTEIESISFSQTNLSKKGKKIDGNKSIKQLKRYPPNTFLQR